MAILELLRRSVTPRRFSAQFCDWAQRRAAPARVFCAQMTLSSLSSDRSHASKARTRSCKAQSGVGAPAFREHLENEFLKPMSIIFSPSQTWPRKLRKTVLSGLHTMFSSLTTVQKLRRSAQEKAEVFKTISSAVRSGCLSKLSSTFLLCPYKNGHMVAMACYGLVCSEFP